MTPKVLESSKHPFNPFGSPILYKETTGSTMEDARRAAVEGYPSGSVCTADHQSAGRGRVSGRRWLDEHGGSVLFTLLIDAETFPSVPPPTQVLALALCRRLEIAHGLGPRIKWPNDVLLLGGKIAGILVEVEGKRLLAGMGVNIRDAALPEDIRFPAASLADFAPDPVDPGTELTGILEALKIILAEDPASMTAEVEKRLYGRGQEVSVLLGDPGRGESVTGAVAGLAPDGALLLRDSSGETRCIYSGEIVYGT